MTNSRRDLLRGITGTAAAPALFALSDQLLQAAPGPDDDQAVAEFWNRQVRLAPPKSRGKGPRPASFNREPTYLFSHKEKGIQVATQMDEEGLPNSGNMEMELIVRGHRLSREDQEIFDDMKTGTLRLDVGQSKPFREVGDLLAWSIVAGLSPSGGDQDKANRAISDYTARSAQSPTPPDNAIVKLPGGSGWATLNFFMKKKESVWGSLLSVFLKSSGAFLPMLGLPGIVLPGLRALDSFMGRLHAEGGGGSHSWVFQNNKSEFCCTVQALKEPGDDAIRMRAGQYILVPAAHVEQLEAERKNLKIAGGFLVPKTVSDFQIKSRIADTLPDLTYIAVQARMRGAGQL